MKKWLFGLLFVTILWAGVCQAAQYTLTEHWYFTSETVCVVWTHDEIGIMFEVKLIWVETGHEYQLGETAECSYVVIAPRVGHFDVAVRARDQVGNHSLWAISIDPAVVVNGEPWRLYFRMAPPGKPIISKQKEDVYYVKNQVKNAIFCPITVTRRYWVSAFLLSQCRGAKLRFSIG